MTIQEVFKNQGLKVESFEIKQKHVNIRDFKNFAIYIPNDGMRDIYILKALIGDRLYTKCYGVIPTHYTKEIVFNCRVGDYEEYRTKVLIKKPDIDPRVNAYDKGLISDICGRLTQFNATLYYCDVDGIYSTEVNDDYIDKFAKEDNRYIGYFHTYEEAKCAILKIREEYLLDLEIKKKLVFSDEDIERALNGNQSI